MAKKNMALEVNSENAEVNAEGGGAGESYILRVD